MIIAAIFVIGVIGAVPDAVTGAIAVMGARTGAASVEMGDDVNSVARNEVIRAANENSARLPRAGSENRMSIPPT
ncbi:MAG: hypothetical protein ACYDBL_05725 [Candidatus Acidiferrales bacterium]